MKKKLLPLLAAGFFMTSAITLAATQFSDVPENEWYANAVKSLTEKGIIEGYDNGTYGPGKDVNRAELAAMLDRLIQYIEKNEENQEEPITEKTDDGPLQYDPELGYYGTFTLTGHLDVQTWECEEGGMCEEDVEYASFVIDKTNNEVIYGFLKEYEGNSFVGQNSVGLGCHQEANKRIYSVNVSDYGEAKNIIQEEDLDKLLKSTKDNPVTLQLTKAVYTSGMGAPQCYSHFRNMEVL